MRRAGSGRPDRLGEEALEAVWLWVRLAKAPSAPVAIGLCHKSLFVGDSRPYCYRAVGGELVTRINAQEFVTFENDPTL